MKTIYAVIAAALVTTSIGCSALNSCNSCGTQPCHISQSQNAPRAGMLEGRCNNSKGLLAKFRWISLGKDSCGCGDECCEASCGCGDEYCGDGCCSDGGYGCNDGGCQGGCDQGCLQKGISRLIDCPCGDNCSLRNGGGFCGFCGGGDRNYNFNPGPPVGQTAYPYYTTRGPRDFLMANPPTIGPR